MSDIQEELDAESRISCARCGKNIWDDSDIQYNEIGAICHKCWHELNPGVYCFTCDQGDYI